MVVPGTSSPTRKCHECEWLSWSPVAAQLQASFRVCVPRPPLTGLPWRPLAPPLPRGGKRTDCLFAFQHTLFLKSSPRIPCTQKPLEVSSLPTKEGQCQPRLPLPLFWPPCLARGQSLQSHMLSSTPPPFLRGLCSPSQYHIKENVQIVLAKRNSARVRQL